MVTAVLNAAETWRTQKAVPSTGRTQAPTEREQNEVSHRRGIRATELRWYFYHIAQV